MDWVKFQVAAEMFEALIEILEDFELAKLVDERQGERNQAKEVPLVAM